MHVLQRCRRSVGLLGTLVAFALSGVACGEIEIPVNLALDAENSFISLDVQPAGQLLGTTLLEGGVSTKTTMDIGLIEILFRLPFAGVVEITDLLFGGSGISILGIDTGTVCAIGDPDDPGGGTSLVDIFDGEISFDVLLGTLILPTSPTVMAIIPDGFAFSFMLSDTSALSLGELLALAFGNADGRLTVEQELSDVIDVEILGSPVQIGISGLITLVTVNELPTGLPLIDFCMEFLAGP